MVAGASLAAVSGGALVLGLWTPLAAAAAGILTIGVAFSWLPAPVPNLSGGALPAFLVVMMAAAIICLGPGALSLDARMFGRREVIIPRTPRPPTQ